MQALAMTDLPVLPLMETRHFTIYSDKLHGLNRAPDGALVALTTAWLRK
jgi:peptide/nickel transport system substrate-binding protein